MQIVWITKVIACDIDRAEVLLKIDARKKLFNPCPLIQDSPCWWWCKVMMKNIMRLAEGWKITQSTRPLMWDWWKSSLSKYWVGATQILKMGFHLSQVQVIFECLWPPALFSDACLINKLPTGNHQKNTRCLMLEVALFSSEIQLRVFHCVFAPF